LPCLLAFAISFVNRRISVSSSLESAVVIPLVPTFTTINLDAICSPFLVSKVVLFLILFGLA